MVFMLKIAESIPQKLRLAMMRVRFLHRRSVFWSEVASSSLLPVLTLVALFTWYGAYLDTLRDELLVEELE